MSIFLKFWTHRDTDTEMDTELDNNKILPVVDLVEAIVVVVVVIGVKVVAVVFQNAEMHKLNR